jgi:diguanylate cyclase (GGDEF)-like protein
MPPALPTAWTAVHAHEARSLRRAPEAMSLVAFLVCAAAILLVAVLFPMSDGAPVTLGWIMLGVALTMALTTYALAHRLPGSVLLAEAALIALLNGVLVAQAATVGGAIGDAVAYLWLIVWVAIFFPPAAVAFGVMIAVAYGAGLYAGGLPGMLAPWALVSLSTIAVGTVMGRMSRIVRDHLALDPLTGALNRGGLHAAASRAATRSRRHAGRVTVAVIDLDGFKEVNDRDGHAEGDRLLADATSAWQRALRGEDLLGRLGGDEFAIVMPGTTPDEASAVLDRLRAVHPVAWSAGLAEWEAGQSFAACVDRADERLYAAKGRRPDSGQDAGQAPGGPGVAALAAKAAPAAHRHRGARARRDAHPREGLLGALIALLPRGRALDQRDWRGRHAVARSTATGVAALAVGYAVARGVPAGELVTPAAGLAGLLAIAFARRGGRAVRSSAVALACMVSAAVVIHGAGDAVEAHFLFFVLVPVVALYAEWLPLAVSIAFVFVHHLLHGHIGHSGASGAPLEWEQAGVHATLLFGACVAALMEWKVSEGRLLGLREEVLHRSADLRTARSEVDAAHAETVRRLSMALEFRDKDTGEHTDRIGRHSRMLAHAAGLPADVADLIGHAAPLHDVGKVAVPDTVLLKPGRLTPEERAMMETHAEHGHRLLRGSSSAVLEMAASIAWTHHERWDGTGYPRGLAGTGIPIEGRIVAIADVWDALTTDRVYRAALAPEHARAVMKDGRGSHFDPELLDLFLSHVLGHAAGPASRPVAAGAAG